MRALAALILVSIMVCTPIFALPLSTAEEPSVGVKQGDWAEYNVTITGNPPPVHQGLVGMRLEILEVENTAFPANVTEWYANGTVKSSTWNFNFTEGNTEGWLIIPANLNPEDTFFDNYSKTDKNIVIQNQQQKTVLGATRTITFGNDSYREKYWDKATGVFVGSTEVFKNWSAYVEVTATNIWNHDLPVQNQTLFYPLVGLVGLAATVLSLAMVIARRRHVTLSNKQQTVVGLLLVLGFMLAVGAISSTPISENQVPLSFRDINVIMQTLWMTLLLVSMWFRKKGNYLIHGILLIMVVSITIVSFVGVLAMSPMNSSSMQGYFGSPMDVAVMFAHAVFSFPALVLGVWLIALWRPSSPTYSARSKKVAWLLTVFWVLSYIVGILDYLIIRIHLFG